MRSSASRCLEEIGAAQPVEAIGGSALVRWRQQRQFGGGGGGGGGRVQPATRVVRARGGQAQLAPRSAVRAFGCLAL